MREALAGYDPRPGEEIALVEIDAELAAARDVVLAFDSLRQYLDRPAPEMAYEPRGRLDPRVARVDSHLVHELEQRFPPRIVSALLAQHELEPQAAQLATARHKRLVDAHARQDLDTDPARRQQVQHVAHEQRLVGFDVAFIGAEHVRIVQYGIDDVSRRGDCVRTPRGIFAGRAEQQLEPVQVELAVDYRLAAEEILLYRRPIGQRGLQRHVVKHLYIRERSSVRRHHVC